MYTHLEEAKTGHDVLAVKKCKWVYYLAVELQVD